MDKETVADIFSVKGKPSINLNQDVGGVNKIHLETLLKQRIEELRQKVENNQRITATTKDAEFKPENIPYIPDSNHPLFYKHEHATIERNAGFQDRALVSPMYLKNEDVKPSVDINQETNIDSILFEFELLTISQVKPTTESQVQPVTQGKQPDFVMGVSREKMHHGGSYFPNEYRPYKPGE